MYVLVKEDFMTNIEKLKEMIKKNNGIIYSKDLEKYHIHRQFLKQLEEARICQKIVSWNVCRK